MQRVLSLDISSTTIGISVIEFTDDKVKLLYQTYLKPDKKKKQSDELVYLSECKKFIYSIFLKYKCNHVAIEEYIKFMKGSSSANTVLTLAILNRSICLGFLEEHGIKPTILNVNTVRAAIKIDKRLAKEEIPSAVEHHLNIKFPWYYKQVNKKYPEPRVADESFDVADAMAVGLAYIFRLRKVRKKNKK